MDELFNEEMLSEYFRFFVHLGTAKELLFFLVISFICDKTLYSDNELGHYVIESSSIF